MNEAQQIACGYGNVAQKRLFSDQKRDHGKAGQQADQPQSDGRRIFGIDQMLIFKAEDNNSQKQSRHDNLGNYVGPSRHH